MATRKQLVLRKKKDNKSEITYIRLTREQRDWIEKIAKEQKMTTSEFIRLIIQEAKSCGVVFQN